MKKVINAAIGGCSFIIDEEAYNILEEYILRFKDDSQGGDTAEVLEAKIADMLKSRLGAKEVVDEKMAKDVISNLGNPESAETGKSENPSSCYSGTDGERPARRLFRDPDGKKIAGVCSGLALYLGVDVTLIRIIFLIALICGSAGFWIYLVIWIASPEARNAEEKCELRGIPVNEENLKRFSKNR